MISQFIKEVAYSFHPLRYQYLSEKKYSSSLFFMSRIIMIAIIIAAVLAVPKIFALKSGIEQEIGKFTSFTITGNVTASEPINIPSTTPITIIDLVTENKTIGDETFLITKDKIHYRFFGLKSINIADLKDVTSHQKAVGGFITVLLLMFLPAFGLLLFVSLLIKYFILTLLASLAFFVLLELTHFRLKFKKMLSVTCHAATIGILLEVLSMPFSTNYLIPTIKFLGTYVYLIPLAIFLGYTLIVIILTYYDKKPKKRRRK
jgi:hypothetical protein